MIPAKRLRSASRWWLLVVALAVPGMADHPGGDVADSHWAYRHLQRVVLPTIVHRELCRSPVDWFVQADLESHGNQLLEPANRETLLRRLSFDLRGLPPTPDEIDEFLKSDQPDVWDRQMDRWLASPQYGERWGKYWLDVVGYADSNGYFNADTDRPLAYRYRDYVLRSFSADRAFDQFVVEQLAGDALAGYRAGPPGDLSEAAAGLEIERARELLAATHFLRNAQDGTGESDGNPDEQTVDRATALEGCLQITMNSLLGITIQCARCHEHKFEPIEQDEYYSLQAVFYSAFPAFHPDQWIKPKDRTAHVATSQEIEHWESTQKAIDQSIRAAREEFLAWHREHRPANSLLLEDDFSGGNDQLAKSWSHTIPNDDGPAGSPAVNVGGEGPPGAVVENGTLRICESGSAGDRWLVSKQVFDWAPAHEGEWIQVTFDLVADHSKADEKKAERIGFCVALHDFDDSGAVASGNILLDGNPAGGAAVHLDYPGPDSKSAGVIGTSGYQPGRGYGVRITNAGKSRFTLEQLVDGLPESKTVTLKKSDLPRGAFGFEYCCGRSFVVDNVIVEAGRLGENDTEKAYWTEFQTRREDLQKRIAKHESERTEKPGRVAFVSDLFAQVPDVHVLQRGAYSTPGDIVRPAGLRMLSDGEAVLPESDSQRRLVWAQWLTAPGSRSSALLSRVMSNRVWQHHFGQGLVATPDNFGKSGAKPEHAQLLEFLATQFIRGEWSVKRLHRMILGSAAYQQQTSSAESGSSRYAGFPLQRLDAEAIRDSMLQLSGELDEQFGGPYVPTQRDADGAIVPAENHPGARRRGVYLQQRRTQVDSLLEVFDAPSIVTNCPQRSQSTVPLQSLALLNAPWVRSRATQFAERLTEDGDLRSDDERIQSAFRLVAGRLPETQELAACRDFLTKQQATYRDGGDPRRNSWIDLCQMLMSSNAFMYIE